MRIKEKLMRIEERLIKIGDVIFIFIISCATVIGTSELVVKVWYKFPEYTKVYGIALIVILLSCFLLFCVLSGYKTIFNAPDGFFKKIFIGCLLVIGIAFCYNSGAGAQVAASICLVMGAPVLSVRSLAKNPNIPNNISDKMFACVFVAISIVFAFVFWNQMTVIDNERYVFNGVGEPCVIQLDDKKLALVSEKKTIKIKVNFEKQDGFFVDEVKKEPKCIILD